ncbi:TetR/AcrR family transcriptional regulator [Luethyella okanaganae]|uniref:TetR/AcrR family transcriptional regulator n=1 Tax=Luethyella okanaganae TaxID=69372 RepID=A0ABW1VDZ7_9MICO
MILDSESNNDVLLGRRERRQVEMRERIVDAAAACFAEQGFDAATMDDIAARADVARATIFNHFGEKQQLLVAYFDRRRAWLFALLDEVADTQGRAVARLIRVTDALSRIYEGDAHEARAMLDAWRRMSDAYGKGAAVADVFCTVIESGQAAGEFEAHLDARAAALALFDACIGAITRWLELSEPRPELGTALHTALNVVVNGIRASHPTGRAGTGTAS